MSVKDRESFEAWCRTRWHLVPDDMPDLGGTSNMWSGSWHYTMSRTSELFSAWQANCNTPLPSPTESELVEIVAKSMMKENEINLETTSIPDLVTFYSLSGAAIQSLRPYLAIKQEEV